MPKCYQLIGVPASGKSTWYKNQDWLVEDKKDHKYVSTDQHVEGYAQDQGKTYSEVFEEYMPTAVKQMMVNVNMASAFGLDIGIKLVQLVLVVLASLMLYQITSILP
jgi:hypothetical protein